MKINNLKDLNPQLLNTPTHVGTWRPHPDNKIQCLTTNYINDLIIRRYRTTIEYNRQNIDKHFIDLYGKPIYYSEKLTSSLVIRIKEVMAITGKSLKEIAKDFKDYLGDNCSFFRKEGEKQIPIDSHRIIDAYTLMQNKHPASAIKNILYN